MSSLRHFQAAFHFGEKIILVQIYSMRNRIPTLTATPLSP
jgi:hypothetical protein